jgi:adenylylsulfate kinase-like enzyme
MAVHKKYTKELNSTGAFRLLLAVFASCFKDAPEMTNLDDGFSYIKKVKKHCKTVKKLAKNKQMLEIFCDCSDNFYSEKLAKLLINKAKEIQKQAMEKIK